MEDISITYLIKARNGSFKESHPQPHAIAGFYLASDDPH